MPLYPRMCGSSLIFGACAVLLVFGTVGSMAIGYQYLAPFLVPKDGVLSTDSWS